MSEYKQDALTGGCYPKNIEKEGKIKVNTKLGYIKATVFGEKQKFTIKSYEYRYKFLSLFHKKSDRKAVIVKCENGYVFYIEYGMFCILTMPDDGDNDPCDKTIFYDL
jgi:hypothetical protein